MSRKTRREFLEEAFLAAGAAMAAAGPMTFPTRSQGAESSSPNERLRVAILGLNGRGRSHLAEYMRRKDCEIAAIVDPDENVGFKNGIAAVEKKLGKRPAFYTDMRRAFDDKSIDIVSIATPNHWHSLAAIWAIQAGKDVYVEKPVSHNVWEGRKLVEAARKYNRIVQAGTQCRTMAGTRAAVEFVLNGGIGEVKLARGLCYKPRGSIGPRGRYDVPAGVDYDIWLGPAPKLDYVPRRRFHYDWHWQWAYGNGDLGNQGIHQMDIARWGLNVDHLGNAVYSFGGRLGYIDAGETANTQVCIHDYGDKKLIFEVRGLKTEPLRGTKIGVIFYGSDGYVVQFNYGFSAAFDLDGNKIKEFRGGSNGEHFANFIDAVRSRRYQDLNGEILQGHLSSALCHLGNISYLLGNTATPQQIEAALDGDKDGTETFERMMDHITANKVDLKVTPLRSGAKLTLDGRREVFTGPLADKANKLLTRKYRKPYVVPETV
ncbi:MAG: gfo/Idh/MocA family oxidoreductase [Planctomycetota bacterium]|nr:MAG: gfo/Idh/MocA family oxidoreductase [Planctomycetota bacterium]